MGLRMNEMYLPSRQYKNADYCIFKDENFVKASSESLAPFLKGDASIRQCIGDRDRLFVYIDRPYRLIELDDQGEFVGEVRTFSELEDFAYGTVAVNDSSIFVEDYRGPPNTFSWKLKEKSNWEEENVDNIKLYIFSRDAYRLIEMGKLKYGVGGLCFDKTGHLFGLCNKLYGEYADTLKIVELSRKNNEQLADNPPRNNQWAMRDLFEIRHYQIRPLIKTPDGDVWHYNADKNRAYCLTRDGEADLISHEKQHELRSSESFIFLEDFVVCKIHEYIGEKVPYKEKLIFKAESYEEQARTIFHETPILNYIGFEFEPLQDNSFVVNLNNETLIKFRIEPV